MVNVLWSFFVHNRFAEVLFFLFGGKLGGDLLVEGGKLCFEGFQLIFLAPCSGGDGLECRQIHTEFFRCSLFIVFIVSYIIVKENGLINEVGNMA